MIEPIDPQPDVPPLADSAPVESYAARLLAWQERRRRIVEMREVERLRFAEIGRLLGISRQRAKQLYLKEKK